MLVNIKVKTNSKKGSKIDPQADGSLLIYVREIAHEGKANEAIILTLSKYYDIAKSSIKIMRGQKSKNKVVKIDKIKKIIKQ